MGDYTGRHRPMVSALRERDNGGGRPASPQPLTAAGNARRAGKRGPQTICLRFAAAVLLIGAVLASAGFLNRKPMEQTDGLPSPRPSMSIVDDGLLDIAAVLPSTPAGTVGAPATGPANTPGRTSPPPTGGGVVTTKGGPAGAWNFEENKGTLAGDSSGNQRSAMLCGGAAWGAGHDSLSSLRLSSAGDGCAYAAGTVLRTDAAFTVSAWVNLDLGAGDAVALAQEGSAASGFYLMYDAEPARWCMRLPRSDKAEVDFVEACAPARPGSWTHLIGVYDPAAGQVRLHVNGARAAAVAHPGMMWRALGYLYIGRARHSGDEFYRWQGSIDEVRAFDYALTDQQAASLFSAKG